MHIITEAYNVENKKKHGKDTKHISWKIPVVSPHKFFNSQESVQQDV